MTRISTITPTQGRGTLKRLMRSIAEQPLRPGDEAWIIGDGEVPEAEALVREFGWPFKYHAAPQTHDWGHAQLNLGIHQLATGDIVVGNDDDDIFVPNAFSAIRRRAAEHPEKLLIFKFVHQDFGLLPQQPGEGGAHGGHCIVAPRRLDKLGQFSPAYDGDQQWIGQTYDGFGKSEGTVWVPEIVAWCRPVQNLWAKRVRTREDAEQLRVIRNECRQSMTGYTDEISPSQQAAWWASSDWTRQWAYLYFSEGIEEPMGFSFLRRDSEGFAWPTYGLAERARGRGLSKELIKHSLLSAQGPLKGNFLASNDLIRKIDLELGWEIVGEKDGIVDVAMRWPPPFVPRAMA